MTRTKQPSAAVAALIEQLEEIALTGASMEELFDACCRALKAGGLPLVRGYISFRVLHPLYEAASLVWTADGLGWREHLQGGATREQWKRSPLYALHRDRVTFLRRRLTGRDALLDFPLLEELKAEGGTDYACLGVAFDAEWNTGLLSSWMTDRPRGFNESHLRDLRQIIRPLAAALKSRIERGIAENIATAYLGRSAGGQVLNGAIQRGQGERLNGALWYSDLRGSTTLAEALSAEDFLAALNAYFDRSAKVILDHGGEVVSYIGDGVLGFFREGEEGAAAACKQALSAAIEAGPSRERGPEGEPPFTLALHYGSFIYGNIGTADRLQFTAIGSAINELARMQDLTKTLGEPLIASGAFTELADGPWRSLGEQRLRGVEAPVALFAPETA